MIAKVLPEVLVPDQFHSAPRNVKIIHVGAGAAGLLTAYKVERMLRNYELICYEKNSTIGGTWLENKYPGCACDIPVRGLPPVHRMPKQMHKDLDLTLLNLLGSYVHVFLRAQSRMVWVLLVCR
jgi:hypothetical protein